MFRQLMSTNSVAKLGLFLIVSVSTVLSAEKAEASFTCGPNLLTYQVRSLSGQEGTGVRCVKISQETRPQIKLKRK